MQSSKKSNCFSFSSRRKQVQEVNSKSSLSFKVLRDKLKLIKSLETSVQETVLCESLERILSLNFSDFSLAENLTSAPCMCTIIMHTPYVCFVHCGVIQNSV